MGEKAISRKDSGVPRRVNLQVESSKLRQLLTKSPNFASERVQSILGEGGVDEGYATRGAVGDPGGFEGGNGSESNFSRESPLAFIASVNALFPVRRTKTRAVVRLVLS